MFHNQRLGSKSTDAGMCQLSDIWFRQMIDGSERIFNSCFFLKQTNKHQFVNKTPLEGSIHNEKNRFLLRTIKIGITYNWVV